jgi:hypothetical protein
VSVFRQLNKEDSDKRHDLDRMGRVTALALQASLGLENSLIANGICLPKGLSIVMVLQKDEKARGSKKKTASII